jgi:hypothetical protein
MHDPKDDRITQQVNNKLASRGFASPVQYAHQKSAAVSAISGMVGVRRVIDQMTLKPAIKRT